MKEKDRKRRSRFSLRLYFILLILLTTVGVSMAMGLIMGLINKIFSIELKMSNILWVFLLCIFVGAAAASYIGSRFLEPLVNLGNAMDKVSKGDFSVRLTANRKPREIRDIYENFNLMVKALESTEILQTDFVANVSHEFKTPITAIEGYAMLLQDSDEPVTPTQSGYIEKIIFNSKRVSALVGNILLLSKIDNQTIPHTPAEFRLDEQIRQTVFALEPEWSKKNIEFEADLENTTYTGNENLLMHVWGNLIGNAVKFSPENSCIRIALKTETDKLLFTVEDEGDGIAPESMNHIFDRFYQGDTSRKSEGNGLGLALVKQILSAENGSIKAENIPGKGCRFTAELPIINKN